MVLIFHLIESEPLTFLQRQCQVQSQKICSSSDGLLALCNGPAGSLVSQA